MAQRVRMKDGGSLVALIADEVRPLFNSSLKPLSPLHFMFTYRPSFYTFNSIGYHRWIFACRRWKRREGKKPKFPLCDLQYVYSPLQTSFIYYINYFPPDTRYHVS